MSAAWEAARSWVIEGEGSEYVPDLDAYRYRCPRPACPWTYTEPPVDRRPLNAPIDPLTGERDIRGAGNRRISERNQVTIAALAEHLENHATSGAIIGSCVRSRAPCSPPESWAPSSPRSGPTSAPRPYDPGSTEDY